MEGSALATRKVLRKYIYIFYLVTANGFRHMDDALFEHYTASISENKKYI